MKTVVLAEPERLVATDRPAPDPPSPHEARVRVRRIGVCGTDLHAFRGDQPFFTYPRVLGHELAVEVREVGAAVEHVHAGDRCAVEPYLECGSCAACRAGRTNCCARLEVLGVHRDGGHCEELVLPARKLYPSQSAPWDGLALVEMWGIGAHAVRRADLDSSERVLVLGAGPIGCSVAVFARLAGAPVHVVEPDPVRRRRAVERFGAESAHAPGSEWTEHLAEGAPDERFPAVIDASGSASSMGAAFDLVRHAGRLIFVGIVQEEIPLPDALFHEREMSVLSSRNATPEDLRRVLALLEDGRLDPDDWRTHRGTLEELPGTLPRWLEPSSDLFKAIVAP